MQKATNHLLISLLTLFLGLSIESQAQSTARYTVSFTSVWNSSDHGTLPGNAHWSDLVGMTHNNNVKLWELGQLASVGIENVAENGVNTELNNEVNTAISNNNADQWLHEGFSPFAAISSATIMDILVSEDFPLISVVSMVAPSPDWFIGIDSFSFLDVSNNWKDSVTIDMFVYDAGTEEGTGYSTSNSASSPHIPIFSRTNITPFNSEKIGTLTITLEEVLSVNSTSLTEGITVFPNPVRESLTISNNSNQELDSVVVYNLLGQEVKRIESFPSSTNIMINRGDLRSGLYLVNLTSTNGQSLVKKVLFE